MKSIKQLKPTMKSVAKQTTQKSIIDSDDMQETVVQSKPLKEKEITSFEDIDIKDSILRGIYGYGFEHPSKIQSLAIKPMIEKKDIIAQSQSGTGKTGAFTIGVLNRIIETNEYPQAIIISNTHELSCQIHTVMSELAKHTKIKLCSCIGGIPVTTNMTESQNSHVLIGTPGRIKDLIERKAFDITKIEILVLDEADELLTREFLTQTKHIISTLREDAQICIFSATLPDDVLNITKHFMKSPLKLLIEKEKLSLDLIKQYFVSVTYNSISDDETKLSIIDDIYGKLSINQCIIYVNSVKRAIDLKNNLKNKGHEVDAIHSQLDSKTRMDIMKQFRKGKFRVLISTDMTSRGIDVQQVSYVINYDVPRDIHNYLHRIGRSGRYGKRGIAINFATKRDYRQLDIIAKHYDTNIEPMPELEELNLFLSS